MTIQTADGVVTFYAWFQTEPRDNQWTITQWFVVSGANTFALFGFTWPANDE